MLIALAAVLMVVTGDAPAQTPDAMAQYQIVFLLKGPQWKPGESADLQELQKRHLDHLAQLFKDGIAAAVGPILGEGPLRGLAVLRAASEADARRIEGADPAVRSGHLTMEIHSWLGPAAGFGQPVLPFEPVPVQIAFLKRGPKWTAEQTNETQKLQEAHMANIKRLASDGKLMLAGPFTDGSDLAGLFLFNVKSLDEARDLAMSDPAVQAGRFTVDVHTWGIPRGVLTR